MQQARAELVLLRIAVLLDEPVRLQRLQQSVDRRPGDVETLRQFAHAQSSRAAGERAKDARGAVDGLDRPPLASGPRRVRGTFVFLAIRHCRIAFGDVDYPP